MNEVVLNALRVKVGAPPIDDKVAHDKRLKEEIELIRESPLVS